MKSVYIHIPFCRKICSYCDFCKFFYDKKWINNYLNCLENEIKETYKNEEIYTLYIGGGTPSSLSIDELKTLFDIIKVFNTNNLKEFTIECNVEDITDEKLKLLKENNVNRLSIGIQTFNKKILKEINREYNVDINEKINLAKKYFDNINVDLMYAFFDQSIDDLKEDLNKFISLNINHISCYSLIIEKNTKFYDKKEIDEELDYEMYKLVEKTLEKEGFIHYEVSNYAKKGFESKHNLVYWSNEEYYGFGLSSSSYINDERITNTKNLSAYLKGINKKEIEKLSTLDKMKYEMILGLRKLCGVNKKEFYNKYNKDIYEVFDIKNLINSNKLIDDGNNIFINKDYIYVSNEILINFI